MSYRPTRIAASRSRGVLEIDWDDGHRSEYPLDGLRAACPCAQCKGHEGMSGPGSPDMLLLPLTTPTPPRLEHLEQVGNYALQLVWDDGHSYGIYRWEYLRELCPCGEHAGEDGERASAR